MLTLSKDSVNELGVYTVISLQFEHIIPDIIFSPDANSLQISQCMNHLALIFMFMTNILHNLIPITKPQSSNTIEFFLL